MICPSCSREANRKEVWGCENCQSADMWERGLLTYKSAQLFCKCFEAGHKESEFKPIIPLTKDLQDSIDNLQKEQDNNKGEAVKHYQEQLNKVYNEDMDYANQHPRKVEIFDE